jgi:hypothetical protein
MTVHPNPFCARHVRPGAMPFVFTSGRSAEQFVERLGQAGWWGQITGPHGSGKSSLLAALLPAIERTGRKVLLIELHDGQTRMPPEFRSAIRTSPPSIVAVDGYEQLRCWNRYSLKRLCRRRGWGLVATAHGPVGFPDLARTAVDLPLACQVVERLQHGHSPLVTPRDVAERLSRRGGDLRETLFDLYDLYAQRQPQ